MMKNKGKGVSIGGGSGGGGGSSPYAFDEESRNKFKHQSLMQDFIDLQKETDAMKKRLQKGKQRKQTLLAEVCFLRRRYKFLKRIQTPKTPSLERGPSRFQVPEIHREAVAMPSRSPVLDLNQISNGEEAVGEYQTYHEPPQRMHKRPKNHSINVGDQQQQQQQQQSNDVKLSVCREVVNGSNRSGKRKISWQDQVALRV